METSKQTPLEEDKVQEKSNKLPVARSARPWIMLLVLLVLLLGAALAWCWFYYKHDAATGTGGGPGSSSAAATGPCEDGAQNTLPDGFSWYENTTLGYKFAYPTAWGAVTVTTTPLASESGNYVQGHFAAKDSVWFGGNATDYIVGARDGTPTDLPGYLKAGNKFYTVELWSFTDGTATEHRDDLHLIDLPYEEKQGCNTPALVTHWDASELSSVGPADIVRFNLQPTNSYYGVNIVVDKPDAATWADVDKLITSFQLIP